MSDRVATRPEWTKSDNAECLWLEDDVTPGLPGHEGPYAAWVRLFGSMPTIPHLDKYDGGDSDYFLYEHGRIMIHSFPGNSEIRLLKGAK